MADAAFAKEEAAAVAPPVPAAGPAAATPVGDSFATGPVPAVGDGAPAEAAAQAGDTLALLRELEPGASDAELAEVEARLRARGFLPRRITPEFRAELDARRAKFMEQTRPGGGAPDEIGPSTFSTMPTGDLRHREALQGALTFLNDKARVFARLQALEIEVTEAARAAGVTAEEILPKLLADIEARNGFKPAIDLPPQVLNGAEWSAMLRGGALFNDVNFKDKDRGGNQHAELTHRLQWTVLMMEMAANPKAFAGPDGQVASAADMFVELGRKRDVKLDWSQTGYGGQKLLWFALFDSFDKAFTSPEAMRRTHDHWPGIGKWL